MIVLWPTYPTGIKEILYSLYLIIKKLFVYGKQRHSRSQIWILNVNILKIVVFVYTCTLHK